jgi:hypothetical protein
VPDEHETDTSSSSVTGEPRSPPAYEASKVPENDDDEATIEDVPSVADDKKDEMKPPKMKSIVVDEWVPLNSQPPIWMRFVSFPL